MNDFNIQNLDLNLLHTLHILLEELNVSRTAARLSLSQSAVSHALAKLRRYFDDPLLIKVQNGMTPTQTAQALKTPVSEIMDRIRNLAGESRFDPAVETITFRIAASDYGSSIILPRLAKTMSVQAPNCTIECKRVSDHMAHDLTTGSIDLAFGGYRPFENFSHMVVFKDRYVGVARKDHPIFEKPVTAEDLSRWDHIYIAATSNPARKDEVYQSFQIHSKGRVVVREPYFLVAPMIVEKSDQVLIMPAMGAKMMAQMLDIRLFDLPAPARTFPFIQVWHRRRDNDRMHKWFRQTVAQVCRKINS